MSNCYRCKWKENVHGSFNVRCTHPLVPSEPDDSPLSMILASLLDTQKVFDILSGRNPMGLKVDKYALEVEWFDFPNDFDAMYIIKCDCYDEKKELHKRKRF